MTTETSTGVVETRAGVAEAFVDAAALAGMLTDLLPFASTDKTFPGLCAVQLQGGTVGDKLVLVGRATDRYGLAETWVPLSDTRDWPSAPVLVPVPDVKELIAELRVAIRHDKATAVRIQLERFTHNSALTVRGYRVTTIEGDHSFPTCRALWRSVQPAGARVAQSHAFGETQYPGVASGRGWRDQGSEAV